MKKIRKIVNIPHPALNLKAKNIKSFDNSLINLVSDMIKTLESCRNPRGVGLAAPQIGVSKRIFIIKPHDRAKTRVFINPKIIKKSKAKIIKNKKDVQLEGCLSIPKIWGSVTRCQKITLEYFNDQGKKLTEEFKGFTATIIQHEVDHLNGILFTQRALEQNQNLYEPDVDKKGKEILKPIDI